MARTIIYPQPGQVQLKVPPSEAPLDGFQEKLLKYIPAETIAFFLPAYEIAKVLESTSLGIAIAFVALLGTLLYLFVSAPKDNPPRWYFYVLSSVALFGWILGISTFDQDVLGINEQISSLILLAIVFLVPLVDQAISRLMDGN